MMLFSKIIYEKQQRVVSHYLWLAKQPAITGTDHPDAGGLTPTDLFILAESVESCSPEEFATYFEGTELMIW